MVSNDKPSRVMAQSFAAVRELALGMGPLHERLESACDALLSLESHEVDETLREEFVSLVSAVFAVEEVGQLADEDAVALAVRVLSFHERVILTG
jgi:hypothetical protein